MTGTFGVSPPNKTKDLGLSLSDALDVLEECTRMQAGFSILVRVYYCEMGELGSLSSCLSNSKRDAHKWEKNL